MSRTTTGIWLLSLIWTTDRNNTEPGGQSRQTEREKMLSQHQLKVRQKHVGASESAAIIGCNPYMTAYDLWMIKTGRVSGFEGNEATAIGSMIEDGLLDWASEETAQAIVKNQYRVHSGGILSATHDALSRDDNTIGYEAKTAGIMNPWNAKDNWGDAGTDEIPDNYIIQCHHQMIVSNLDMVYVPALIGGRGRIMYKVRRNEKLCDHILKSVERFWNESVLGDIPPYGYPHAEYAKKIQRIEGKKTLIDTELVKKWQSVKNQIKDMEEYAEALQGRILGQMDDAEIGECDIGQVKVTRSITNRLDTKALKAAHPALCKEFIRESESVRMTFKKDK